MKNPTIAARLSFKGYWAWSLLAIVAIPNVALADATTIMNPSRIPVGDIGAVEGGAMIARANDGAATWYNPAGLARAERPSVSSNASLYEINRITAGTGANATTSSTFNIIPSYMGSVGFLFDKPGQPRTAWGFSVAIPLNWKSIAVAEKSAGSVGNGLTYGRFSSAAEVRTLVPVVGLAHDFSAYVKGLSIGVSIGFPFTTEYQQWTLFERRDKTSFVRQAAFVQDSMALNAQAALGIAWHPTTGLDVGLSFKLPSIGIYDNTSMNFGDSSAGTDGVADGYASGSQAERGSQQNLSYRVKHPAELGLGVAYSHRRLGLEFDSVLRFGVSPYSRYGGQFNTDYVLHLPNKSSYESFSHSFNLWEERPIVNMRIGGFVAFSDSIQWHIGGFTDRTPFKKSNYDDYAGYYQKVDLYGITSGFSYSNKNSLIALGASYTFSGDLRTESYDLETRENVTHQSSLEIIGFILSGRHYF